MPPPSTRANCSSKRAFVYDSDAYNDDLPYYVEVKGASPRGSLHADIQRRSVRIASGPPDPTSFFDYCRRGLDYLWDEGETFPA